MGKCRDLEISYIVLYIDKYMHMSCIKKMIFSFLIDKYRQIQQACPIRKFTEELDKLSDSGCKF